MPKQAKKCEKCIFFNCFHPKYSDSFSCKLDNCCSWLQYKANKVCCNYEEKKG